MKKSIIILIVFALMGLNSQAQTTINGAGATFPYPVYSQWAYKYNAVSGVQINYQSIGSGGGIQQIKAKTVDFGASDAPLKKEDLDASGLAQFPLIMGGVVPVINVKGIMPGQLKLSGDLLAKVFMGTIDQWDDPAIKALNPNLNLPDLAIAVIHRADGSGTTWIFTNYLSTVSGDWKTKIGADKAVAWPTGLGGKGNEGVSAYVQQVNGSIGYVEYAYALQNKMTYVQMQNKAGKFVSPDAETFSSAAANADWKNAPGFYMVLVNQPGDNSWPITGASFILIYKNQTEAKKAKTMLDYFDWCFKNGKDSALKLDYVPLPDNVVKLVEDMWRAEIKSSGKAIW
jgi:phosphate transport system substrate-binding protein